MLVVDDEHTLRETCASVLQLEGYDVTAVGRGQEALELIKRRPFDVVLLDRYMSQVDGLELLRAALAANPHVLAVVMTGNPSVESSVEALRQGAWDYLPKPFSAQHLQIIMGRATHTVLVGQETRLEQFGVYGSLIRRKRTLGEAIATVFQLLPFFSSGTQMWIEDRGDRAVFCQRFADGLGDHRQADQYSLMMMITLLRLAAGPTWHPDEVHLRMPRGARFDRFPPLASCVVRFEQPANAVVFPRSLLDRPLAATGLPVLKPETLEAWTSSAPAPDFPGSLLQVAEALPPSGYPQIGAAAGAVGMSVRSLQRRLAESGVTFKGIMADERFAAAAKLLRGGYAKILDIALDLGYSDHAHFTRAFHRWAGTAPREFRRLARQPA